MFAPSIVGSSADRVSLGDYGRVFSTRARAVEIRAPIDVAGTELDTVIFDFAGVMMISQSFADELFGVLAERFVTGRGSPLPMAIGLSAQSQRVLLASLRAREVPEESLGRLIPASTLRQPSESAPLR